MKLFCVCWNIAFLFYFAFLLFLSLSSKTALVASDGRSAPALTKHWVGTVSWLLLVFCFVYFFILFFVLSLICNLLYLLFLPFKFIFCLLYRFTYVTNKQFFFHSFFCPQCHTSSLATLVKNFCLERLWYIGRQHITERPERRRGCRIRRFDLFLKDENRGF